MEVADKPPSSRLRPQTGSAFSRKPCQTAAGSAAERSSGCIWKLKVKAPRRSRGGREARGWRVTRPGPEPGRQEGSGCGILIRLGPGDAKEALPPYCVRRCRARYSPGSSASAEPRGPEAHSDAGRRHPGCGLTFALRGCAASGRAPNPTPCRLPELFLQHGGAQSCPGIQPLVCAWPSPGWR